MFEFVEVVLVHGMSIQIRATGAAVQQSVLHCGIFHQIEQVCLNSPLSLAIAVPSTGANCLPLVLNDP
ncbi:hypothetical protein IFO70_26535 [Phormidium tenue FACHB-886]|nr:hypothetical protein [Phormidium tenue FACHB-886]